MTDKLVRKMQLFTVLLASVIARKSANSSVNSNARIDVKKRESTSVFSTDYELAPEILDDRSFALAAFVFDSSDLQLGLSVHLVKPGANGTGNECFIPMKLAKRSGWPVRRLSRETVLLLVGQPSKTRILLVNTDNCKYGIAHDVALPANRKIFISENSSDERFTLIAHDKEFCRGFAWCRLFFDPSYYKFEPLNFDFSWSELVSIKPVTSFDGDILLVRLTDATDAHKVRLYDVSSRNAIPTYKELFVVESDRPVVNSLDPADRDDEVQFRIALSRLSYCTFPTPDRAYKFGSIHCSAFREDGTVTFNRTVVYPRDMMLRHLRTIPNGFVVIAARQDCVQTDGCWHAQISVITKNDRNDCSHSNSTSTLRGNDSIRVKHHRRKFECLVFGIEMLEVRVDECDGSIEVEYLCAYGIRVSYHTIYVVGNN